MVHTVKLPIGQSFLNIGNGFLFALNSCQSLGFALVFARNSSQSLSFALVVIRLNQLLYSLLLSLSSKLIIPVFDFGSIRVDSIGQRLLNVCDSFLLGVRVRFSLKKAGLNFIREIFGLMLFRIAFLPDWPILVHVVAVTRSVDWVTLCHSYTSWWLVLLQ